MSDTNDATPLAPHETSAEGVGEALTFSSTLRPGSFLGLSIKNGLLNLITLTLYRFWGKTEVRQRVWRGVRMNDEAFEYTGRGMELFIGFLLALLVLGLPFLIVVFGIQFLGEAALFVLPFLYIFFFWLWGFGVFTAFRYMASRTTWRGIRFQLKGSAAGYGWRYLAALVLSGITMGWFWPYAERKLANRVWGEVRFGDRRLRFRMERSERVGLYGPYALGWFGSIGAYIVVLIAFVGLIAGAGFRPPVDPAGIPSMMFMLSFYAVALLISPLALLIWAPYQAAVLRSIAAGITLDDADFKLEVRAIPLWWLTVVNLLVLLVTLGFLMPWVQARTARFLVERLKSSGTARLDLAHQATRGPGSGEGLADAFGFGAI